ncbi:TPR repeat [Geitlerinema sp. FC II]|nr:TPR repeat [Geitlerinema sp. FC II]
MSKGLEKMSFLVKLVWGVLLYISMPWQLAVASAIFIMAVPPILFRLLPFLLVRFFRLTLVFIKLFVGIVSFSEYIITQSFRQKGRKPPHFFFVIGDFWGWLVEFIEDFNTKIYILEKNIYKKNIIIKPKLIYILPLIFIPVWFIRPYLKNPSLSSSIDRGIKFWCSLEHWSMTGKWQESELTCQYPTREAMWPSSLKPLEYNWKNKIKRYTKKLEIEQANSDIYNSRAKAYLILGNIEAAFKDFTASVKINPSYAPGYVGLGNIYMLKDDYEKAFKEYTYAKSANPNYAPAYTGRGDVYLSKGDKESAFKEYSVAKDKNQMYVPAYIGRGDVYKIQLDKEAARQEYEKAIEIDSDYAVAYEKMGDLYLQLYDNREAAIPQYEIASKLFLKAAEISKYNRVLTILEDLKNYTVYVIKRGDTLNKISRQHGVSLSDIISYNRETYPNLVSNPDLIEPGWKLKIPAR